MHNLVDFKPDKRIIRLMRLRSLAKQLKMQDVADKYMKVAQMWLPMLPKHGRAE